ncbi:MAG: ribonuclease P protein component [Flavobacterium sp.]|nr:ribonuclease P protein component [Flavobacterium sp.]
MDFKYPKKDKLKSRKTIDLLFTKGKSVAKYPLRLVYIEIESENKKIEFGVSVSKKHFKNAVDRNYFKRVLRECYRLNKQIIIHNMSKSYALMFFYQTSDRLNYSEINEKTIQLFEKWVIAVSESEIKKE